MIYACIKMLQEWATPLTVVNYTLFGGASGFMLATVFAARQVSAQTEFFGGWAIILTLLVLITRAASLFRNDHVSDPSQRYRRPSVSAMRILSRKHREPWRARLIPVSISTVHQSASTKISSGLFWFWYFPLPLLLVISRSVNEPVGSLPGRIPGAIHRSVNGALVFLRTGEPPAKFVLSNGLNRDFLYRKRR